MCIYYYLRLSILFIININNNFIVLYGLFRFKQYYFKDIWLLSTHCCPNHFYFNDIKKEINGKKVTIKGLKNININIIVFSIVAFIVILLLFIFIGIPLYFNGHLVSTIHNLSNIRNTILPILICMVILYKLTKIRNMYVGIVFINSLSTLLGFTIAFNTLSGSLGFYCKQTILKTLSEVHGFDCKHMDLIIFKTNPLRGFP
uniref:Uncharacterized protein n=1 Tax=Ophiognomonia clavigignenti-juglandacearum TaxID=218668 RepID=A0A291LJH3_9PEZI|nr:hypothetical protein [Ophiognomonia clavigignenti-juglandacearum]